MNPFSDWLNWDVSTIWYLLVPLAPLCGTLAAGLLALHSHSNVRNLAHWPCIAGTALAFLCSLLSAIYISHAPGHIVVFPLYTWIAAGRFQAGLGLYFDSLACTMICLVSFISLLVAVYSVGYMRGDEGYGRYFAVISLFVWSMIMLVLADNYLALYMFWEGVGLCSYLLIGHWYDRPAASAASFKAFLVNRVGDASFLLAILVIWFSCGTLHFGGVSVAASEVSGSTNMLISLLLLGGACAKSAQFPLHIWLPDAMEGPTPVSALIHAATMVTAGVYLLARSSFLLAWAPEAQLLVAIVGTVTALLGAIIAMTQQDLKRVLAYSTMSQLGLMFISLGVAGYRNNILSSAAATAIFHLCMHGFFKALLFLCAGNIMHATNGIIDMRLLGGLRRGLPKTHICFAIGALALAGIPPLAGFWSKDAILEVLVSTKESSQAWGAWALIGGYLLTSLLTAFYITRAYLLTFWTEERLDAETVSHLHEPSAFMLVPVMLLAVGSVILGGLLGPTSIFRQYIGLSEPFGPADVEIPLTYAWIGLSILTALVGAGSAIYIYGLSPRLLEIIVRAMRIPYAVSAGKFFIDELYWIVCVRPGQVLAIVAGWMDRLVDGVVDLVGWFVWYVGRVLRPMQNGQVQFYALAILLGIAVFCLVLISRWGG